jgi:hypothetical protein
VFLGWKQPAEGGRVSAYLSACEPAQAGSTLVDQPKGKELEYRVIAINKSGEGSPSNTVVVVL